MTTIQPGSSLQSPYQTYGLNGAETGTSRQAPSEKDTTAKAAPAETIPAIVLGKANSLHAQILDVLV